MKSATLIRLAVCAVLTIVLWWIGWRHAGVSFDIHDTAGALVGLMWSILIGFVWMMILGWPMVRSLGEKFGNFYTPSDKNFRVRPEYSIAEARVKQGLYREAVAAFRADSEKFPDEAHPHVRIAELLVERFDDPVAAIEELKLAVPKCKSADSLVLVSNLLADLHVWHTNDRAAAVDCLREIALRYPDTKQARAATEKIQRLTDATMDIHPPRV